MTTNMGHRFLLLIISFAYNLNEELEITHFNKSLQVHHGTYP